MKQVIIDGNKWGSGVHPLTERYPKERQACKVTGYDFGPDSSLLPDNRSF